MNLLTISLFVVLMGLFAINSQITLGKHSSSSNEDKKTDSNNDPKMGTSDKQTNPTNGQNGQSDSSDTIPITPAVLPQCDSSNTNPTCVAATNELIKEQTELEKQRMLIAQQQQEQNEISLENQRVIDNINAAQSQDQGTSTSGSGSSSSSSDEQSSNENKNLFFQDKNDKNLSDRFIIAQTDDNKIGLYKILSDEKAMNVYELHNLIRPISEQDNVAEALQHIQEIDNRSN